MLHLYLGGIALAQSLSGVIFFVMCMIKYLVAYDYNCLVIQTHYLFTLITCMIFLVTRIKLSNSSRLELSVGNDVLSPRDDKRLVSSVSLKNATVSYQ